MKIRKAVITAAGLGTRFYPLTKAQPKEMLPVLDKPVIHYVVEEAVKSGLDQILMVVGKGKDSIINYFDQHALDARLKEEFDFGTFPEILFVRQREPNGLADAVRYARNFTNDEPFVLMLGDTIYTSDKSPVTAQLAGRYEKLKAPIIAVERVPREKIRDYGIVSGKSKGDGLWRLDGLVEKPEPEDAPGDLGITGTYVLTSDVFDAIRRIAPGKNGEYQLTDALNLMCRERDVYAAEFDGKRYDIGTKELWVKTFIEFAGRDKRFSGLQ
jgi:UTP--glucose-1-phosphate uridylyltransferase